ncbi:MAG TPA: hypothetical protein VL280_04310 [Burkholderiales bacterium]|jgi:hypothetical protein|nr:hypothetical protein [Burkholderiales bacterium]
MNDRNLRIIAAIGLVAGTVLGIAGTFTQPPTRGFLWALDGFALIVASALLVVHHHRQERDLMAAGFIVFAIGQGLIVSGAGMDPGDVVSPFAAGAGLWACGIALVSAPAVMPFLVRILGFITAVLFAIFALRVFSGTPLTSLSTPLPSLAYPFLGATLFCWAWLLVRGPR